MAGSIRPRHGYGAALVAMALVLGIGGTSFARAEQKASPAFQSDDPVAVRAMLSGKPEDAAPRTLSSRIHELLARFPHGVSAAPSASEAQALRARNYIFVVDAPIGILYQAKTRLLKVDVPLADDDRPGYIVLNKTVKGMSGRRLVIAPDAKAKGFVQNIDRIDLDVNGRTTAQGRLRLSQSAFDAANGDFAIALLCRLTPPYLTDEHEHREPTDDEPTDITTRTSTLHVDVQEVWLIDRSDHTVLSTRLRLTR
ncbi:MAG TPA: hypothetical protein VNE00_04615 [Paraburkholderia sp.]|nr:hypothetical protein [Paraburkholderia sp.]